MKGKNRHLPAANTFSFAPMKLKRALLVTGIILTLLLSIYFLFRNSILHHTIEKIDASLYQRYGLHLHAEESHFTGFDRIDFQQIMLYPPQADTVICIRHLSCNLSLLDLLTGKAGLDELKIDTAEINIYPDRNNLHLRSNSKLPSRTSSSLTIYDRAVNLRSMLLHALQTSFEINEVHLHYEDTSKTKHLYLPYAHFDLEDFSALLINTSGKDSIRFTGKVLQRNQSYQLQVIQSSKGKSYLPFLNNEHGLRSKFDSIAATLTLNSKRNEIEIITDCETNNFVLNHWRIAKEDVVFPHARFKGVWRISKHSVELDSASRVIQGPVALKVYARYSNSVDTTFSLSIAMPETVSDSFFHALPQGMFHTLKGISCTGSLQYGLDFFINTRQPDSLQFSSSLAHKNFRLNHYGAENYARINAPFVYDAYDKDRFMRSIVIGPDNPHFTPLPLISDYLIKAVLQSEDPSFMQHCGFLPEAFRESIVKNYKERRFARGGSTISMQLVKNVFLSRDKTISRKAEEALIVYLMENFHLVSKERMLEIYLNIIEWGPNVYGIGEASRFYFNKRPSELTLQESIFLAAIIPAPKYFRYRFDKQGHLKQQLDGYFRILTGRMARKGWLSSNDTSGLLPDVKLTGPALRLVVPADSLMQQEEEQDF